MTLAGQIRNYVTENFVLPARARGDRMLTIRAGDVHSGLGLKHRVPSVCSVLGAHKFQENNQMSLIEREGPQNGSVTKFVFDLTVAPAPNVRSGHAKSVSRSPSSSGGSSDSASKRVGFFRRLFGG